MRLPTDLLELVLAYVDGMDHYDRYQRCLFELYYLGFTSKPKTLKSITWIIN